MPMKIEQLEVRCWICRFFNWTSFTSWVSTDVYYTF